MRWPADTRESQKVHAFKHVKAIENAISLCKERRCAVQAGGNVGLWPMRMATTFKRVLTFEPEPVSLKCLEENVAHLPNVTVRPYALGAVTKTCGVERRSLGSHRIMDEGSIPIIRLDSLNLYDVDLLQLDVEGYEAEALTGGMDTIRRCRPVIQVEILDGDAIKEHNAGLVREIMSVLDYRQVCDLGRDYVFCPR